MWNNFKELLQLSCSILWNYAFKYFNKNFTQLKKKEKQNIKM